MSITNTKSQIYSPQEYLSSANNENKGYLGNEVKRQNIKKDLQEDDRCFVKKKESPEIIPAPRKRGLTGVKECFTVLDKVYNHQLSEPFRHEIKSKDVPEYYKKIKRGMCYDMVAHKLRNGIYEKLEEFTDDMRLIFSNCFQYHEQASEIYQAGIEMEMFFQKKMDEMFPNKRVMK